MAARRLVQNFSHRRAVVVSNDERVGNTLASTLGRLGLIVDMRPGIHEAVDLSNEPLSWSDDVIFVDADLPLVPHVPWSSIGEMPLAPVIGLVGVEAPSRLKALIQVGATAFLYKPVYAGSVFSTLYLAVNEYARKAELCNAIEAHEGRRRQRRFVIKAVVQLMSEQKLDDDAAFALLRKRSMQTRLSIEAYCQYVVQRSATVPECGTEGPLTHRSAE